MQKQTPKKFEYIIKVNSKIVWRGLNPKEKYWKLKEDNPNKRVSVAWETNQDVLLCIF